MTIRVATRLLLTCYPLRVSSRKAGRLWRLGQIENLDVSDLFSSEIKRIFAKVKIFILWSIPVGILLGALSGVSSHQSDINGYFPEEAGSLASYVVQNSFSGGLVAPLAIIGLILLYVIFWFPSIVAKQRGHAYTSIIQILNIATLFTGITWFIAAAWAIFPSEKSLIDPVVGNPTGLGRRNAGDTIGSAEQGLSRGKAFEEETDKQIQNLIDMRSMGLLSDEEFLKAKRKVLQRDH